MKKKALLFGTLPAIAVATGLFIANSNDAEGTYQPRNGVESQSQFAEGAFEYYEMIRGEYSKEDFDRVRAFANGINQDRATYNWTDHDRTTLVDVHVLS